MPEYGWEGVTNCSVIEEIAPAVQLLLEIKGLVHPNSRARRMKITTIGERLPEIKELAAANEANGGRSARLHKP